MSAVLEEHILADDWEGTRSREVASVTLGACLALHALQHHACSCSATAYTLVTRLVVAAERLIRPPDRAADTTAGDP